MSRYTVMGADRAGSWTEEETDSLVQAAKWVEDYREYFSSGEKIYFVTDENRDGGTVPEEEIEEALASEETR